jgi:hypothetical protein
VPIVERLSTLLADHAVLMDHPTSRLLFPSLDGSQPISTGALRRRAEKAWEAAGLEPPRLP